MSLAVKIPVALNVSAPASVSPATDIRDAALTLRHLSKESLMNAPSRHVRLLTVAGAGVLAVALVGVGVHLSSGADKGAGNVGLTASLTAESVSVSCPDVASQVGEVPAQAQAGVTTELANLERQIVNVNSRLAREPGQAANQLNDLAGKRGAVIDRIILDFTRVGGTEPAGLRDLVECSIAGGASGGEGDEAAPPAESAPPAEDAPPADAPPADAPPADAPPADAPPADGGAAVVAQTVNCPTVEDKLPEVPAGAQAEVDRNLTLLTTQIAEADARLAKLAVRPEGGPNFVANAITGPLEDKRFAVLNRIATAVERITKDRPGGLVELAPCGLNG
jgi:hypothetical protein